MRISKKTFSAGHFGIHLLLLKLLIVAATSFTLASEHELDTKSRIRAIQIRIDNFKSLTPNEKQQTLDDQIQLVKDQLNEFDRLEAKLRKQRNLMIIQSDDIKKQETRLATLFEEMGWQKTFVLLLGLVLLLGAGAAWFAYRSFLQKQAFLEQE